MRNFNFYFLISIFFLLSACGQGGKLDFKVDRFSGTTANLGSKAGPISAPVLASFSASHQFLSQTTAGEAIKIISETTANGFKVHSTLTAELIAP